MLSKKQKQIAKVDFSKFYLRKYKSLFRLERGEGRVESFSLSRGMYNAY